MLLLMTTNALTTTHIVLVFVVLMVLSASFALNNDDDDEDEKNSTTTLNSTANAAKAPRRPLYILWLFGFDGSPHGWGRIPLGRLAFQDLNRMGPEFLPGYKLVALERPTSKSRADLDVKQSLGVVIGAIYEYNNATHQIVMATCPPYTPEATAVAQLTPNYNLITMAGLSASPALSDKKQYPLFFRTSTSAGDFKYAALTLFQKYSWRQVIGLYMDDPYAVDTAAELEHYLEATNIWFETKTIFKINTPDNPLAKLLKKTTSRIILAIANGDQARYAICQLYQQLGANGREYVYIFIGISVNEFQQPRPYDMQNCTLDDMQSAINGSIWLDYGSLTTDDKPIFTGYRPGELRLRVRKYIDDNYPSNVDKTVLDMAFREYEAIVAIAVALNNSIQVLHNKGLKIENFTYSRADIMEVFKRQLLKMSVPGPTGAIEFQKNGDRPASVTVRQFQAPLVGVGQWMTIATQHVSMNDVGEAAIGNDSSAQLTFAGCAPIVFGTLDGGAPYGMSTVGFFASGLNVALVVIGIVLVVLVIPAIFIVLRIQRQNALNAAMRERKWLLDATDFYTTNKSGRAGKSVVSLISANLNSSSDNAGNSNNSSGKDNDTTKDSVPVSVMGDLSALAAVHNSAEGYFVAKYQRSNTVCLFPLITLSGEGASGDNKALSARKQSDRMSVGNFSNSLQQQTGSSSSSGGSIFKSARQFALQTKAISECVHDNLTRFHGVVVFNFSSGDGGVKNNASTSLNSQKMFTVYDWLAKGSLNAVLDVEFDTPFKISLSIDIVCGLSYIHQTFHFHGFLQSSNIFLDNRFCCKISDYGYNRAKLDLLLDAPRKVLLWSAPELVSTMLSKDYQAGVAMFGNAPGMQKADIFSYAVVLYELVTCAQPYEKTETTETKPSTTTKSGGSSAWSNEEDILDQVVACHTIRSSNSYLWECFSNSRAFSADWPKEMRPLVQRCCASHAHERPAASDVWQMLRKTAKLNGMSDNIMENLLRRVEVYAKNLESLVQDRTQAFFDEKKRAETLLYNILPKSVADQLKEGKAVEPEFYDHVSIYFSDVVGFTNLSSESTPMQVVTLLNDLYNMFDNIIADYDVYKVETIGDAYMVVSGLPQRNGDEHARQIARMSRQLVRDMADKFRVRHKPEHRLYLRVGLHSGPCAAGVVGFVMPRYCLFGDTVNTASRMESTGEAMRIHVSNSMREQLMAPEKEGEFVCELRGEMEVKGKGKMITYWLVV